MPSPPHSSALKQTGTSSLEFLLIATVLCTLLLLCYDSTRAWMLRQVLLLALQESGRSGTTLHLEPNTMLQRFDQFLAAWWPSTQHQRRYYNAFTTRYGFAPWRMWQLSPTDQDFKEHADKHLSHYSSHGYAHINNQHQLAQHLLQTTFISPQQSIFDANTLRLQVIYWYEPSFTFSQTLLRWWWPADADPYLQQGKSQGLLPIRLHFSLPMQSHPIQWPLPTDNTLQRLQSTPTAAIRDNDSPDTHQASTLIPYLDRK